MTDPSRLNHYPSFSNQVCNINHFFTKVYGEISHDLVRRITKYVKLTKDDVFIDLGSGVGHVVLQIAASTSCKKAYGIEIADCPSEYAKVKLILEITSIIQTV